MGSPWTGSMKGSMDLGSMFCIRPYKEVNFNEDIANELSPWKPQCSGRQSVGSREMK